MKCFHSAKSFALRGAKGPAEAECYTPGYQGTLLLVQVGKITALRSNASDSTSHRYSTRLTQPVRGASSIT